MIQAFFGVLFMDGSAVWEFPEDVGSVQWSCVNKWLRNFYASAALEPLILYLNLVILYIFLACA